MFPLLNSIHLYSIKCSVNKTEAQLHCKLGLCGYPNHKGVIRRHSNAGHSLKCWTDVCNNCSNFPVGHEKSVVTMPRRVVKFQCGGSHVFMKSESVNEIILPRYTN